MTQIITFQSFRRGAGKTCLVANLASIYARGGRRVGILDFNLQYPSLHFPFHVPEDAIQFTLNQALRQVCDMPSASMEVGAHLSLPGRLFLVPASPKLEDISRAAQESYSMDALADGIQALCQSRQLDLLLVDLSAGVSEDTFSMAALSDTLVIVLRPDKQDYQGTAVILDVANQLEVPSIWLVTNLVPSSFDLAEVAAEVERSYQSRVAAVIPATPDILSLCSSDIFVVQHPTHPVSLLLTVLAGKILNPPSENPRQPFSNPPDD